MKELKIPKLIEKTNLPKEMSQKKFNQILFEDDFHEFIPSFIFDAQGHLALSYVSSRKNDYYVYAVICYKNSAYTDYYDYALVKTDDFYFKTYADYKKAVKEMSDQLVERWKTWVEGLYQIGE